jgi:serine/threonine protein kinase
MREPQAGRTRLGDYNIVRELGDDSGCEAMFEAVHVLLPRRVVLRMIRPELAGISSVALQLMRQAYILEALRNGGVPRMYECGRIGDSPWIAVELVSGERLARRMSAAAAVAVVRELAAILAHAHARGIVHGDLRREHVVRAADDRGATLCIKDWSSARLAPDGSGDIAALGALASKLLAEAAPPGLAALLARMQAVHPAARPSADEVIAIAGRLAGELLAEADSVLVEEIVIPPPERAVAIAGIKLRV